MNLKNLTPLLLGAALVAAAGVATAAPKVGQPAPDFSATDTTGKIWKLSDLADKRVVLEWTNHDCPFVRKHYDSGNMQALQRQATAEGVLWLSVISSASGKQGHVDAATADRLSKERDASPTAVLLDPEGTMGRSYGARTTPHMYIIDKGVLVYMGGVDSIRSKNPGDVVKAEQYVSQALASLAAGEPVAKAVTRPYGCSVKY